MTHPMRMRLRTLSLFSGIGGFELGLERSGLSEVVAQIEIDPFCRSVLAKHWPTVARLDDVRTVSAATVPPPWMPSAEDSRAPTFPSRVARSGLDGDASGLWREFSRIIGELGPRLVLIENVAGPWRSWLPIVRRDLWQRGYASVPVRMRAADVGLPHGRPRIFVVAYTDRDSERLMSVHDEALRIAASFAARPTWDADSAEAMGSADGVPSRMDRKRLKALGNAIVVPCAEAIGRAVVSALEG